MCSEFIMTCDSSFISTSSWIHAWISLNSASTEESHTEEHLPLKTNVFNDENDQDCGLRDSPPCWSLWCVLKITAEHCAADFRPAFYRAIMQLTAVCQQYAWLHPISKNNLTIGAHSHPIVDAFLSKMSILNQERLGVLHGKSGWMH